MASRRTGTVIYKKELSSALAVFRMNPEQDREFPVYTAGQYIAIGRDDALLPKKVGVDADGKPQFVPDLNKNGQQRTGPVMHSYSIASAPWETGERGYLEFYVVQETAGGALGRLSTVLLGLPCCEDEAVNYVDRIVGSFTLEKLVQDATRVVMVGTGTGLAPFISMIKQLYHQSIQSRPNERVYTLIHTNRTLSELGYHQTLREIEAAGSFDFLYLPTVSRPTPRDTDDPTLGVGRATNVLRHIYGLPMTEEEQATAAEAGPKRADADAALARAVRPSLPSVVDARALRDRFDPTSTVILTCGNPASTSDVQETAEHVGARAEVEPW